MKIEAKVEKVIEIEAQVEVEAEVVEVEVAVEIEIELARRSLLSFQPAPRRTAMGRFRSGVGT